MQVFIFFLPSIFLISLSLVTSSVTYCEPPETLLVQQFDVVYFANNQTVFFNISAASVVGSIHYFPLHCFMHIFALAGA